MLAYILPFPQQLPFSYHDQWIASIALSLGKINYINRPLYAYRQHSANVIGHYPLSDLPSLSRIVWLLKWPLVLNRSKGGLASPIWNEMLPRFYYLAFLVFWAKILNLRVDRARRGKQRAIKDSQN